MKCSLVSIPRLPENGSGTHYAICFTLSLELIKRKLLVKARELSKSVNDKDPSGSPRTEKQKLCRAIAGLTAEYICSTAIKKYAKYCKVNIDVFEKNFISPSDQIDLSILRANQPCDIEIRSSGHYKQDLIEIYNRDFNLLGWYITSVKSKEKKKDFYITVLFPFHIDDILENKEIKVYIAGGATKKMFHEKGIDKQLKQQDAKYRIISPIVNGLDGAQIISEIVSAKTDNTYWSGIEDIC